MTTFVAESEDALIAAIRAGVVPDGVLQSPAEVVEQDGLHITPSAPLTKSAQTELARLGFQVTETTPHGRTVASWPQIVGARRQTNLPELPLVLFVAPSSEFASLVSALLRLGADRQDVAFFDTSEGEYCATKVVDPPYYVVLSAMEGGAVRAYRPASERTWIELGFDHPLAEHFLVPDHELLLIGGTRSWTRLADGPWRSIYTHLELSPPGRAVLAPTDSDARLQVPLHLAVASQQAAPTLWVLRGEAHDTLDALVRSLPQAALRAFAFARLRTADDKPVVVIRARTGHEAPALVLPDGHSASAYVSFQHVDHLFVPVGSTVRPPLRVERIRETLAPDTDALAWLVPTDEQGAFRVEYAPVSAFAPLDDWVDHVAAEDAVALQPWFDAAVFEFDSFVGVQELQPAKPRKKAVSTSSPKPTPRQTSIPGTSAPAASREHRAEIEVKTTTPTALDREIAEVEGRLIDLMGGWRYDRRAYRNASSDWRLLASLYRDAGRANDAALAYMHALWPLTPKDPQWRQGLRRWDHAEDNDAHTETARVRAELVGALLGLARGEDVDIAALNGLLNVHGDALPTRLVWLVYESLARHSGDRLAFVRAQDVMRLRLRGGLRLADDIPGFVRRVGQDLSGGASSRLVGALSELYEAYATSSRERSDAEAPEELTEGYVQWVFAWGFAQLGESPRSIECAKAAEQAHRDATDPIHTFLRGAFRTRVEHARTGRGLRTPLPLELHQQLEALPRMDRYKVDRLRDASFILEGSEVDAFGTFRTDEPAVDITDPAALPQLVDSAIEAGDAASLRRAGVLLQLMPEYDAIPRLATFIKAAIACELHERTVLIDDALLTMRNARTHRDRQPCVRALEQVLDSDDSVAVRKAARVIARHATSLQYWHRELRNVLRERLDGVTEPLAQLELATLMVALGGPADYLSEAATRVVSIKRPRDWLEWHRQHAFALARLSPDHVIEGMRQAIPRFTRVTDSFQTNSHFCLSVVHFMESLVLGLARADLALTPEARRMIDFDEQCVRERIFVRPVISVEEFSTEER